VTLVHVEYLGRGQPLQRGERADRPHPTDTSQDLLPDAVFLIAAIQAIGDAAQLMLVFRDVRIQQQQRDATHLRNPDPCAQLRAVRQRQRHQHRITAGVGQQPQRESLRVQRGVRLLLPTVCRQRLPKVAGTVVQTDRDQRDPKVGRGLEVVAGQDPKSTRIIGQNLGYAEFHGEVGDTGRQLCPGVCLLLVPQRAAQVVVQFGGQSVEPAQEAFVERQFIEPHRLDRT
jgi:hypothetical protein